LLLAAGQARGGHARDEMSDENDDLWNEAMALLLRWQETPDDPRAREDIRRFCALDEEHQAAWNSAKRLYRLTGEATGAPQRAQQRRRKRELTRRGLLTGLGAIVVGGVALKGPDLWRRWQADMVSAVGVIDQRTLPDGSKLTLGPDSALQIDFSPTSRSINLLDGMAMFDVTDDPARPFEVRTGALVARTNPGAASFEVRQNSGSSLVGVGSGSVKVEVDSAASRSLTSGDWIANGPGRVIARQGHRDPGQIAAWRERKLIADESRIDSIVAEIARWQSGRVVIADWDLASSRVSGLYDLNDPIAALGAVVRPYGGRVRQVTPWLTVLSRV
jgi:transmembrane sensor